MLRGVEELADAVKVTMGPKVLDSVEMWSIGIYVDNGLAFNFLD